MVLNGDVLTDLSLGAFAAYHQQHGALVTVATTTRNTKMDFGIIEQGAGRITHFREKPVYSHLVSMGIYCMEPEVLDYIPQGVPFGFDDLILCLLSRGLPVFTFGHNGMWMDIGRVEDFQSAQQLSWDDQPPAFEIVDAEGADVRDHGPMHNGGGGERHAAFDMAAHVRPAA
jgi:NDP-sugar pyrophosphorylase family protein